MRHLREGHTLMIRALDRLVGTEQMTIELTRDLGPAWCAPEQPDRGPTSTSTPALR